MVLWMSGLVYSAAVAQTLSAHDSVSANDFGGIGLMQTRTARFGRDGGFEAGTSFVDPYRRWYFRLTFLPWFEGTFRYTDIRNRLFSEILEFSGNQSFKDRGADIKFRLWPESDYIPQIAVGMQDGLGTGLFRSEYFVASKRFRDLDLSFGLAWGYLGNGGTWKNPLTSLNKALRTRSSESGTGGAPLIGSWFAGEFIAPFFGLEYRTPITGLTLKVEREGNDYRTEPLSNVIEATSPWNYGFNYRPFDWLDVSMAYERGNIFMSRIALLANLHDPGLPKFDPAPPLIRVRKKTRAPGIAVDEPGIHDESRVPSRLSEERSDQSRLERNDRAIERMFVSLEQAGLEIDQFEIIHEEARIHFARGFENSPAGEAERLASMVVDLIPAAVERVAFVDNRQTGANASLVVSRDDIERKAIVDYLFDGLEAEGFYLQSFDLSHESATLSIAADNISAAIDRDTEVRAAQTVLRASPRLPSFTGIVEALFALYDDCA